MRTKLTVLGAAIACVLVIGVAFSQEAAKPAAKDGKALFLENKCNNCHSIDAQKVAKKASAEEGEASESSKKAPDLSSVGLDLKADFMDKFLNKTADIKGEKHPKKWKGTPEDLSTITKWLETQKAPKKAAK
jgi:mono/diheme cytochrome c family protein